MHHISNEASTFPICDEYDLMEDELVPIAEVNESGGRWFNCGKCFEVLHGSEKRPNPPAPGDAS